MDAEAPLARPYPADVCRPPSAPCGVGAGPTSWTAIPTWQHPDGHAPPTKGTTSASRRPPRMDTRWPIPLLSTGKPLRGAIPTHHHDHILGRSFEPTLSWRFPWQDDKNMKDVMKAAHIFLQSFCLGNRDNQALMHKYLDVILKVRSHSTCTKRFFNSSPQASVTKLCTALEMGQWIQLQFSLLYYNKKFFKWVHGLFFLWWRCGAKTIKKNTNSTPNKSQTHRAKAYKVTSFLSKDCELSTETCSKNVYSPGLWSL